MTDTHPTNWSGNIDEGTYQITAPATVQVSGRTYNFVKWEDDSTNLTREIELTADLEIAATYEDAGAGEYVTNWSSQLDDGTYQVTTPETVEIEGITYTFVKWNDESIDPVREIMLAANTEITATYAKKTGGTVSDNPTYTINTPPVQIKWDTFREKTGAIAVDYDHWANSAFQRSRKTYGEIVSWSFTCFENAVSTPWVDSIAYALYPYLASGKAVGLTVVGNEKYSVPEGTTVYVKKVTVTYSDGMRVRYIDLELQKAGG